MGDECVELIGSTSDCDALFNVDTTERNVLVLRGNGVAVP